MPGQPGESAASAWPNQAPTDEAVSADNYLSWHLRGLIRAAARHHDPEFIDILLDWIRTAYQQGHPYIRPGDRITWPLFEGAAGERLLREVLNAAIEHNKPQAAESAISAIAFAAERLIPALPVLAETSWRQRQDNEPRRTREEREREQEAEDKVEVVSRGYIEYLGEIGKRSVEKRQPSTVQGVMSAMDSIMERALDVPLDPPVRRRVITTASWTYFEVLDEVLQSGMRVPIWSPFDGAARKLESTTQDGDAADRLLEGEAQLLRRLRESGRVDYTAVDHAAGTFWPIARNYIGKGAVLVREFGEVYNDLSRVDGEAATRIREEAKGQLDRIARWAARDAPELAEVAKRYLGN